MIALWMMLACGAPSSAPAPVTTPAAPVATAETPSAPTWTAPLGLGRAATAEEVAAWDKDVDAGWNGLPEGRGSVAGGKALYAQKCLACHAPDAKGGAGWIGPRIVATEPKSGFGEDYKHPKSIGNYWPYASTLFDYIRRSMPQNAPGSLTDDETFALTAFLLAENEVVPKDFVADPASLKAVVMPTKTVFVRDDRGESTDFR